MASRDRKRLAGPARVAPPRAMARSRIELSHATDRPRRTHRWPL